MWSKRGKSCRSKMKYTWQTDPNATQNEKVGKYKISCLCRVWNGSKRDIHHTRHNVFLKLVPMRDIHMRDIRYDIITCSPLYVAHIRTPHQHSYATLVGKCSPLYVARKWILFCRAKFKFFYAPAGNLNFYPNQF